MSDHKDPFISIDSEELTVVSGGAARVASGSGGSGANDQLMQMLTEIGNSIKDLARNTNGGQDQMSQMLMMMMMMGGFGGGGGGGGGYAPAGQPPTYVQVTSSGGGGGGGGGCGCKGW
jgi:hypothetical protein